MSIYYEEICEAQAKGKYDTGLALLKGLSAIAEAIHALGVNHACGPTGGSPMGAIECLAVEVSKGFDQLSDYIMSALTEGFAGLADSIENLKGDE